MYFSLGLTNPPFQFVTPKQTYNLVPPSVDIKNKFKTDFETHREKLITAQPALKSTIHRYHSSLPLLIVCILTPLLSNSQAFGDQTDHK